MVVTGPSGVGKGTLIRGLLERVPGLELAVSATTRPPREGEVNGRDYWFLSEDDFDRRVAAGDFVEHAVYAGNRYGTLRSELERPARGIVLEIDLQGARQVRESFPDAVLLFLAPPSWDELVRRLVGRGTEDEEERAKRLRTAEVELASQDEFDATIVNSDVAEAAREVVERILEAEAADVEAPSRR